MFIAQFQPFAREWAGSVVEIPGVNTQGSTLEEARENLQDALCLLLESKQVLARQLRPANCIHEKLPVNRAMGPQRSSSVPTPRHRRASQGLRARMRARYSSQPRRKHQ